MRTDACPKCAASMEKGKALLNIYGGYSDFPGGSVITMSPTGKAKLVDCLKCPICGHSVRMSKIDETRGKE